ncbi:FadD3 family acyl-CoA ligase [Hoyosella altamirensis]|uniref:Acyl-CoA synthetase (AMP-forming)/AMP-acid ligase II n=1 Tax=Hoyosella altamirensis TaxID=616997 RepID=A0A839RTN9_9ACTN|nr:FadD3 family acyl-CoA ligase [Hoyosella altamirensis]MBB3039263.1 acyl-CoA synthetase (AMP-forming)/AMP-acid ligase II [Hoyosella altamirensis]
MSPFGHRGSIPAALRATAEQHPNRDAIIDGETRLTYRELLERVQHCAGFFIARDIRPGDRIAVWSPNTHHWLVAALGALTAGATLVPINTRFTGGEALDILARTHASALIVAGPFLGTDRLTQLRDTAGNLEETLPALRTIVRIPVDGPIGADPSALNWDDMTDSGVTPAIIDQRASSVAADDVCDILFTSGTTGRSKGAMSSHAQSLGVAAAWADIGRVTHDDRYLIVNPFFHSFGYKAGILVCILTGAAMYPQATFDVDRALEIIERERITVLPGAPTIYQMMLEHPRRDGHDLSSLRLAVTGAATVPVTLVERMRNDLGFGVVLTAYGLTEAVVATMCRPDDHPETVATTCGRAAASFEVRVVQDGTDCAPGEQGEVLLRGPNVMLGYLDDPDSTEAAIDAEGWLHTGDAGTLSGEGYLKITDRIKDMYVSGGFNVYPAEVEQCLARLPGVAESAVIGVPDERLGEVGRAYVRVEHGHTLSADQVITYAKKHLANYKVPRQVHFIDALPRNPAGKVLKRDLRESALQEVS